MPNYINNISKAPQYVNTGLDKNYLVLDFPYQVMLIPKGKQFTQTEMATPYSTLVSLCSAATDAARGYPIGPFIGMDDKSTDAVMTTSATGSMQYVRHGKIGWELEYDKGGMNMEEILTFFHDNQDAFDLLIFNKATNGIIGTTPPANTSSYVLKGFTLEQIYVPTAKWNTGNEASKHRIGFIFGNTEEFRNNRLAYQQVPLTQDIMSIVGLKNLEFVQYSPMSSSVIKFRITTFMGATDLYDLYATALVALTANFSFRDESNNALTCTVSADAATKTLVFTFSGAAFTALTTGALITGFSPTIAQMTATVPGYANTSWQFTK